MTIRVEVDRRGSVLEVRWSSGRGGGSARFDHVPGTVPEWVGAADDLLAGATRRDEGEIVAALARWADEAGASIGVWHDGGEVEVLR